MPQQTANHARRAGERVRVNAQLIDVEANRHVWAQRFDRQMEDVFELQDDIVTSITANGPARWMPGITTCGASPPIIR